MLKSTYAPKFTYTYISRSNVCIYNKYNIYILVKYENDKVNRNYKIEHIIDMCIYLLKRSYQTLANINKKVKIKVQ